MTSRIVERDRGWRIAKARFLAMQGASVKVGVFFASGLQQARRTNPVPVSEVAALQEYGTRHASPRPFLGPTIDKHSEVIAQAMAQAAGAAVAGDGTLRSDLEALAATVTEEVRAEAAAQGFRADGQLVRGISSEVVTP